MVWVYLADALWILALSVMAGASREAGKRMARDARVPMPFATGGRVVWRAPRRLGLAFTPVLATVIGLILLVFARDAADGSFEAQVIVFGVRALIAPLFALAHLAWLRAALRVIDREGALKP